MKSRELLDKILQSPITKAIGGCFMKNDELETIKKDIELLERLKKILQDYCEILNTIYGGEIRMYVEEYEGSNNDEFKLLKEVLENDN